MSDIGGIWYFVAIAGASLALAFAALFALSWLDTRRKTEAPGEDRPVFLFDRDRMIDASRAGWAILRALRDGVARHDPADSGVVDDEEHLRRWRTLFHCLKSRFPDLPALPDSALALAPKQIASAFEEDTAVLLLSETRGRLRLEIRDDAAPAPADRHVALTAARETRLLHSVSHLYPYPVWLRRDDGRLLWANRAFQDLDCKGGPESTLQQLNGLDPLSEQSRRSRVLIERDDGDARWHEIIRARSQDGIEMGFAVDIDSVVVAETNQRKFVQTLTKTFAQLSTGLAIFDRHQQLQLFNPALLDLLSLPGEFLSARPTLLTFFDKLRENRMMPEPKNYSGWRQQIADLVTASNDGRYQETWTLPMGLTYRVTGRPHPDGAIALLFEDISAEISLTRRFRAQLNLGQSVIDSLDEGIAVFTARGILSASNAAFREMWKMDPENSFAEVTIRDATRQWKGMTQDTPFWAELNRFAHLREERHEWFADIVTTAGERLECRVTPLPGGATLVGFRLPDVLGRQPAGGETWQPGEVG